MTLVLADARPTTQAEEACRHRVIMQGIDPKTGTSFASLSAYCSATSAYINEMSHEEAAQHMKNLRGLRAAGSVTS